MSTQFPLAADDRYAISTATLGQTAFTIPFPFQAAADIVAIKRVGAVETLLAIGDDYQIVGENEPGGGTLTLTVECAGGEVILLIGDAVLARLSNITQGGKYSSLLVEKDLDRLTLIAQELARDIGRGLKVAYGGAGPEVEIGAAGYVPIWDAAGNLVQGPAAGDIADAQANGAIATNKAAEAAASAADAAAAAAAAANKLPLAGGTMTGPIGFTHQASPANPAANVLALFAKTDNKLYTRTAAGAESEVGSGGGSSLFATKAAVAAHAPATAPDYYQLSGNLAAGDLGEIVTLFKAVSEPAHPGKLQNGSGTWYELDRHAPINPFFFETASHAGDHGLAFDDALATLIDFGGGTIRYPLRGVASDMLDWLAPVTTKVLPAGLRATIDFGKNAIKLGPAMKEGGAYQYTEFLKLTGDVPVTLTDATTATNFATTDVNVANNTIAVASNANTWLTGLKVRASTTTTLPGGLAAATDYWVIRDSATTIKLATTLANAVAGTAIDITDQGTGTHTLTRQTLLTNLYSNYAKFSCDVASLNLKKGDRFCLSDTVNFWNNGNGDGKPTNICYVDYVDTTNNIINFYPPITFPITISNTTTGELSTTGIMVKAYNADCYVDVDNLVLFGDIWPQGVDPGLQGAGGSAQVGLVCARGVFRVSEYDGFVINTALRITEGLLTWTASHSTGSYNGYGLKCINNSHAIVDHVTITGSRHAIGVGGSTQDGASAIVTNSVLGGARQAYGESLYPGGEYGPVDLHPSAMWCIVDNCDIFGGFTHANGLLKISNSRIFARQIEGVGLFDGNGGDNGVCELINNEISMTPYIRPNDDVGNSGSFSTQNNLFRQTNPTAVPTNWTFRAIGNRFIFPRGTSWPANTDMRFDVGSNKFKEFLLKDNEFLLRGTTIRRLLICSRGTGTGLFLVDGNRFDGCGVYCLDDTTLAAWVQVFVNNNVVLNDDITAFVTMGLAVNGDQTSASVTADVQINGNYLTTYGTTAGIHTDGLARRSIEEKDNTVIFSAASGALGYAMRANRNQQATGQHTTFVTTIRGNKIMSVVGANTITAGIQISGLNVSGSLVAGKYLTGDNIVETATTPITTTGSALTAV